MVVWEAARLGAALTVHSSGSRLLHWSVSVVTLLKLLWLMTLVMREARFILCVLGRIISIANTSFNNSSTIQVIHDRPSDVMAVYCRVAAVYCYTYL